MPLVQDHKISSYCDLYFWMAAIFFFLFVPLQLKLVVIEASHLVHLSIYSLTMHTKYLTVPQIHQFWKILSLSYESHIFYSQFPVWHDINTIFMLRSMQPIGISKFSFQMSNELRFTWTYFLICKLHGIIFLLITLQHNTV